MLFATIPLLAANLPGRRDKISVATGESLHIR